MKKLTTRQIALAAVTGALYVVLSYLASLMNLAYGPIQFRFSEALTVLPFLSPVTAWGLFVGCVISNILSPYGVLDLIVGSAATLIAGLATARCRNRWLAPLPPVICNGLLVGAMLAYYEAGLSGAFWGAFAYNAATVSLGELAVCYVLGLPLLAALERSRLFEK